MPIAMPRQRGLGLFAGLWVAACVQAPGPPPLADTIPPPANLATAGNTQGKWDGVYSGEGFLTLGPGQGLDCQSEIPVSGMTVADGHVRFGNFRGPVGTDGAVRIAVGPTLLEGTFTGGSFYGSLFEPFPGCHYQLQLAGPSLSRREG